MNKNLAAACVAALCAASSAAFEVDTHARITAATWTLFLGDRPTILGDLGIVRDRLPTDPKSHQYYDARGGSAVARYFYQWEAGKIYGEDSSGNPILTAIAGTPAQWLMQGVVREDDSDSEPNPKDDPFRPGPFNQEYRVLNHFFDPLNRRPLHIIGVDAGLRADDWAIGRIPGGGSSNTPDPNRVNDFTVFDAREAMYRALTGMDGTGNPVAATEMERNRWWATTFRALGDVIHLLQDMGQPQHTRNDPHAGVGCPGNPTPLPQFPCLTGHKSVFEQYVNNRALGAPATTRIVCPLPPSPIDFRGASVPLSYTGYPVPRIDDYGSFFASAKSDGFADYTNRGFFTVGTNIGSNAYALPSNSLSGYTRSFQDYPLPCARGATRLALLMGDVPDPRGPTATNVALSAEGIWTALSNTPARYVLVRANYDAMASLVIPRAVSFSASMLQYFFRGTLEIKAPDIGVMGVADHSEKVGFAKLKLKVKNTTKRDEWMTGGSAVAVVRYRENGCYTDDLHGEYGSPDVGSPQACRKDEERIVASKTQSLSLQTDEEKEVEFDFSANPLPFAATDLYFQVVYRGPLGQETDAVAVGTLDVPEPLFFALMNISDVLCVNGSLVTFDGSGQKLTSSSATAYLKAKEYADSDGIVWEPLRPAPYEKMEIRFAADGANPANTIVRIDELPPQRFARIAVLTDRPDRRNMTVVYKNVCGKGSICSDDFEASYRSPENQRDYKADVLHYRALDPWRGAYAYGYSSIYKHVDQHCESKIETFTWPEFKESDPVAVTINF